MKDLSRKVTLLCRICGNDQFESLNDDYEDLSDASDTIQIRCSDCGSVYTKEELISENQEVLDNAIDEIKKDAIKELEKMLKKW